MVAQGSAIALVNEVGAVEARATSLRRFATLAPQCRYNARKLAERLDISPRQLQRIFAATLACAPQDWLNRQRLLKAREMLPVACSVKEVAYALDFRKTSQFSRDFRLAFGFAPSRLLLRVANRAGSTVAREGALTQL